MTVATKTAVNPSPLAYWSITPFIDLMKSAYPRWVLAGTEVTVGIGTDLWFTGLPASTTYSCCRSMGL